MTTPLQVSDEFLTFASLINFNSETLIKLQDQVQKTLAARQCYVKYKICCIGDYDNHLNIETTVALYTDNYASLEDFIVRHLGKSYPALLTPENVRCCAFFRTSYVHPSSEISGTEALEFNNTYLIHITVKHLRPITNNETTSTSWIEDSFAGL